MEKTVENEVLIRKEVLSLPDNGNSQKNLNFQPYSTKVVKSFGQNLTDRKSLCVAVARKEIERSKGGRQEVATGIA